MKTTYSPVCLGMLSCCDNCNKVTDHINDDKADNRLSNLQIMTQQANCKKSAKNREYSFAAVNHKNRRCVKATNIKALFTWSGGPRSSGVGFFCFHALADTKQKKPTPLDRGPPPPCKQGLI